MQRRRTSLPNHTGSKLNSIILLVLLALGLAGCTETETPEPVLVYITATFEPQLTSVTATNEAVIPAAQLSTTTPEASVTLPPASSTNTPAPPTATATATVEEAALLPSATLPLATPSRTPPPAFPSSTPSQTSPYSPTPRPPTITPEASATPSPTPLPENPLLALVPPVEQLPVLDSARMGIQIHPFITGDEWFAMTTHAKNLGMSWIKIQLPWDQLEPSPGNYNNELFNRYVLQMATTRYQTGQNMNIMLSIAHAPQWTRPQDADFSLSGPPADPQALANFLRAFMSNFEPGDGIIDAIEIWNEPNLLREWSGVPMSGGEYMRYFRAAYDVLKEVAPNVAVVTAGLAPVGDGVPGAVGDRTYLQQMYDAGLAQYPDVKIGVHPYGWGNPPDEVCCNRERGFADNPVFFFRETLQTYADIMRLNGHNTKMWVTEFGWGTYKGLGPNGSDGEPPEIAPFFNLVTPEQQAQYIVRAFEMMQYEPFGEVVELAFLWNMNFGILGFDQRTEQAGYGLLDASGQPRLSFFYLLRAQKIPLPQ